jgi:hypothetical protein
MRRDPSPQPFVLDPEGAFAPDPDCWHCVHNPGYPHRHWRLAEPRPAPRRPPNWIWRALFRLYGEGGTQLLSGRSDRLSTGPDMHL